MKSKPPEYTEVKCDYVDCDKLANVYFNELTFQPIQVRALKTCPAHSEQLIEKGETNIVEIPYIDIWKQAVKCMKCSYMWTPRSFHGSYNHHQEYMKLPSECPHCGSKTWTRNSVGDK
jgi:Zn finger protein HypA/HybF involved in hydrogenase expression